MPTINWKRLHRNTHRWVAIVAALPLLVIIVSGVLLQFKKELSWIQPPTRRGSSEAPSISFDAILDTARSVPEAQIDNWDDIDRLDVRPSRGLIKVRAQNGFEVQLDHTNGEVLHVAYRRSDMIEQLHDGSFFHPLVKHWLFVPVAAGSLALWITGVYLFLPHILSKRKSSNNRVA